MATILYLFLVQVILTSADAACVKSPVELYRWDGSTSTPVILTTDYSKLNPAGRTYFVVHGWTENGTQVEYRQIAANYHEMDPTCNVILVDYRELAQEPYLEAHSIVNETGTALGKRIVRMLKKKVIQLKNIQMYGHSLGAHICGLAAKIIKPAMCNQRVPRISTTEPAGPLFRFPFGLGLLDPLQTFETDMLDVTHTTWTAGTLLPFGDVDTYVDYVTGVQPACAGVIDPVEQEICDHAMARAYFTESIRTSVACKFQQYPFGELFDPTTIVYGQHMPLNASGIYSMYVNANPPYARGTQDCNSVSN